MSSKDGPKKPYQEDPEQIELARAMLEFQKKERGSIEIVDVATLDMPRWKVVLSLFGVAFEEEQGYSTGTTSAVGYLFVALCFAIYFFWGDAAIPMLALDPTRLGHWGGLNFISYAFVHADALHLIFNFVFLMPFLQRVEAGLGGRGLFYFILTSAFFASAAHLWGSTEVAPLVGASGVCFAAATYYALRFPKQRLIIAVPFVGFLAIQKRIRIAAPWLIAFYVLSEVTSLWKGSDGVSHWGHLGGALAGFLFWLFAKNDPEFP